MSEPLPIEAALRVIEPAVRLVPERHLRKILHYLRDHGCAVPVNLDLPFWITRGELTATDILPAVLADNEPRLLLISTPDDRNIDSLPVAEQLRAYWRLLFQSAVMAAVDAKIADGSLSAAICEVRLARFGPAVGREIRYVLETEHFVDPQADGAAFYRAFAAAYLDLHAFVPDAIADFFPSLPPAQQVLDALGQDLDAATLLAKSRPAGAVDARRAAETIDSSPQPAPMIARTSAAALARALEAEQHGNFVRAAILRTQTGRGSSSEDGELLEDGARTAIGRLVHELAGVLEWNEATQKEWRHAIIPLLVPAATGIWPRAARCLYELQKIPSDLARDVFAVDLVEPVRTLGRRPIKRPLPHARDVMLLLKIRAAQKQLLRSGLDPRAQQMLDDLFHREIHRVEHEIRHKLTPIISTALTESGFRPSNRVEEVARDKLVAELLDRVCERGYLRFGDLRDAVARNQLKMADLAGPVELIAGDALLRTDTRLAYDLDGIYRRGEFYLRALQRGSSFFFGTKWGRWIFLYLIAPFLAAFLTLTFAIEVKHISGDVYNFASKILAPRQVLRSMPSAQADPTSGDSIMYFWDEDDNLVWVDLDEYEWDEDDNLVWIDHDPVYVWDDDGNIVSFDPDELVGLAFKGVTSTVARPPVAGEPEDSAFPRWEWVFTLGVFLLLVFHVPSFRRAVLSVLSGFLNALRLLLWEYPSKLLGSPAVVAFRYSAPVRFLVRYLSASILVTAAVAFLLWFLGASPNRLLRWGSFVFAAATIACNTPWGRGFQERLAESVSDGWRIVRINLLPGFVTTILDWFRRLANWVERQLYAVDEWLRYRGGDSGRSLALKALIGLFWFPFAYCARFAFYLLIEPQINPVKHFPVVTVSHKVLLPLVLSQNPKTVPSTFGQVLIDHLGLTVYGANFWGFWIIASIPGIFGFIAWELLANWRLYAANRHERLKPVVIGSHGESMRGLLRPGFHSGAVPKLFRKLRRAEHQEDRTKAVRFHHDLHHSAEGVHRFVDRELVALLKSCPEAASLQIEVDQVQFGCQRAVVSIAAPGLGPDAFALSFENRGGRIAAAIEQTGWLDKLTAPQRAGVLAALRGLFDMAAAELYGDRERTPDAKVNGDRDDELLRPYSWTEWVERWKNEKNS